MKKISLFILAVSALLTGCKGFLVEEPFLTQSNALALADYNGINGAVAGAYGPLASSSWYGADFVLSSEMRADNATIPVDSKFTSGRHTTGFNMSYAADATVGVWAYAYYIISAANNVLEAIETNGMDHYVKNSVTEQDVRNLQAECLFLRALSHFDIARTYAYSPAKIAKGVVKFTDCVPYIFKTDKTATEQPSRNSVEEVFGYIIEDLIQAESLIAPDYARAGVTDAKATVTLPAIQALLSRVYLYNQDWQGAADYATKVIANPAFKLWTAEEYPKVWGKEIGGSEVIFEVYGSSTNDYDGFWEGPSHLTNPRGYADVAASGSLTSLFDEPDDVRGTTGVRAQDISEDPAVMFCTDPDEASGGQLWTMKYQGKGKGDATSIPDVSNTIVLRLSEMYLNRAEALLNGAKIDGATAAGDITTLREHRGVGPLASCGFADVQLERRKELNFEGHYWFDLWRTADGEISYSDTRRPDNIEADSKYWALAIPKREYNVNNNLSHNPGFEN